MMSELVKSKDPAILPLSLHPSYNYILNEISPKYFDYQDAVDLGSSYFMCQLLGYFFSIVPYYLNATCFNINFFIYIY